MSEHILLSSNLRRSLVNSALLCHMSYDICSSTSYSPIKNVYNDIFHHLSSAISFFDSEPDTQSIIARSRDGRELYVVVRGTNSIEDIFKDVDVSLVDPIWDSQPGSRFHNGFLYQADKLIEKMSAHVNDFLNDGGTDIFFLGHSAGGCIASIMAYYYSGKKIKADLHVITIGSPSFTNCTGSIYLSSITKTCWRIYHRKDPIPCIFGNLCLYSFAHASANTFEINKKGILMNSAPTARNSIIKILCPLVRVRYHSLDNYIKYFLDPNVKIIDYA